MWSPENLSSSARRHAEAAHALFARASLGRRRAVRAILAIGLALLVVLTTLEIWIFHAFGLVVGSTSLVILHAVAGLGFLFAVRRALNAAETQTTDNVRAAVAHVPQGILLVGPDGVVQLINEQVLRLLELPARFAAPGVTFSEIVAYQFARAEFSRTGAEIPMDLKAFIGSNPQVHEHPKRFDRYERTRPSGMTLEVITRPTADGGFVRTFEDVTHRKKLESDLRAREQEARTLARIAEVTPHFITVTGIDRRITWANPAFCESVGKRLDEVIGKAVDDLVHLAEAEKPRIAAAIERVRQGEKVVVLYDRDLADGSKALVSSSINPLLDPDGRVTGVVSVVTDITELHAAERTLRRQQSLLEEMSELAEVGAWDIDLRTQRLTWSAETRAIHEVDEDYEPTVGNAIAFYRDTARAEITTAVERAIAHGRAFDLELPLTTAKGRDIWVRARGRAEFENGAPIRVVGAFQDVTAAREAANENRLLAELARQTPTGFMLMDEDGVIRWINEGYTRMSGFTLDDVVGKTPSQVFDGSGTDHETVARVLAARRAGKSYTTEVLNYRKSGEPYWVSIAGSPLRDEQGNSMGFIAIETDISDRRRQEETTRRYQNDLERFTHVASHDLQEPLRKIGTHA